MATRVSLRWLGWVPVGECLKEQDGSPLNQVSSGGLQQYLLHVTVSARTKHEG